MGDTSKKPWESKTIIINAVLGLCAAVLPFLPQAHYVQDFIAANAVGIGIGWSVLNMVLRAVTKDKISLVD